MKINEIKNKATDLLNILLNAAKTKNYDRFLEMDESCISVVIVKQGKMANLSDTIQIEIVSE